MPANVRSLWPSQIRPTIQSPWMILDTQARALTEQTNGLLLGRVKRSEAADGKREVLSLEILVPALDNYYQRVLVLAHDKEMPYPAMIDAEIFRPKGLRGFMQFVEEQSLFTQEEKKPANRADSDEELIELVRKILQSPPVVSLAQSLIARANDALAEKERQERAMGTGAGDTASETPASSGLPEEGEDDCPTPGS